MVAKLGAKIPYITKIVMGPNFVKSLDKIYSRKQICNKTSKYLGFCGYDITFMH